MDNVTFTMKYGYPGEVYQLHKTSDPNFFMVVPFGVVPDGYVGDGVIHGVTLDEVEEAFESGMWIKN